MISVCQRSLKWTAAARGMLWAVSLSSCATDPGAPNPGLERRQPILGAAAATEENVVLQWDEAALAAIRQTHPGPPQAARALAIAHTSMFDAWAAYDAVAVGTRLGGTLRRPAAERTLPNKERAVSYAAYRALVDLFPSQTPAFDALMANLGYAPNDFSTDVTTRLVSGMSPRRPSLPCGITTVQTSSATCTRAATVITTPTPQSILRTISTTPTGGSPSGSPMATVGP